MAMAPKATIEEKLDTATAFKDEGNTHYKAKNFGEHVHIQPGAAVGPKNGLSILLDTETFDYSFHLRASEGFKVQLELLFTE